MRAHIKFALPALALAATLCGCSSTDDKKLNAPPESFAYKQDLLWGESFTESVKDIKKQKYTYDEILLREDEKPFFKYERMVDNDLLRWKLGPDYKLDDVSSKLAKVFLTRVIVLDRGHSKVKLYYPELVPYKRDTSLEENKTVSPHAEFAKTHLSRVKYIFNDSFPIAEALAAIEAKYGKFDLVDGQFHKQLGDLSVDFLHQRDRGGAEGVLRAGGDRRQGHGELPAGGQQHVPRLPLRGHDCQAQDNQGHHGLLDPAKNVASYPPRHDPGLFFARINDR